MTRINADLAPESLMDQHLMAEYRELPMVYASLRRSLRTKSVDDVLKSIPSKFCLNGGHVRFFYDKLVFLQKRYDRLIVELEKRNFALDPNRRYNLQDIPNSFHNDWVSNVEADLIVKTRIDEKIKMKPLWYRKTNYEPNTC